MNIQHVCSGDKVRSVKVVQFFLWTINNRQSELEWKRSRVPLIR